MPLPPDRLRAVFCFEENGNRPTIHSAPSYRTLRDRLDAAEFDALVETACAPWRKRQTGRPPVPAGIIYRLMFAAFLEGSSSHRSAAELCRVNLSVRDFVGLGPNTRPPHHSTLGAFRAAVPEPTHVANFELLWKIVRPAWSTAGPPPL